VGGREKKEKDSEGGKIGKSQKNRLSHQGGERFSESEGKEEVSPKPREEAQKGKRGDLENSRLEGDGNKLSSEKRYQNFA